MRICPACGAQNRLTALYCSRCGFYLAAGANVLAPGTRLYNRYIIVRMLKQGGMSVVYLAEDTHLGNRRCVVKEMMSQARDQQARQQAVQWFEREAILLSGLQHPNIPRVIDHFTERGRYYLVMDYVDGENLEEILSREGRPWLDESRVVNWAMQICDVLVYLHEQNPPIIFRDLKPANVMLQRDGRIKLIDFGVARRLASSGSGTAVGTPGYAPPEQYFGRAEPRSDLYSLGATLHHLLSGRAPDPYIPFALLRTLNPSITPELEAIVAKALSQNPQDRQQSAREFRQALEDLNAPFRIFADFAQAVLPWQGTPECKVIVKVQSKQKSVTTPVQTHFCLLLDVSGSMKVDDDGRDVSQQKYWPMLRATEALVDILLDEDLVSIVLFAKGSETVLSGASVDTIKGMHIGQPGGRIDGSNLAKNPGDKTWLLPALSTAMDLIGRFEHTNIVHRLIILTDGRIFDIEAGEAQANAQAQALFANIASTPTEVYAYGFGDDWQEEPLRSLVALARGGELKKVPLTGPYDIENTFKRFGLASKNILATNVELTVQFEPTVRVQGGFKYSPIIRLLKPESIQFNTFRTGVEALELGKEYAWGFALLLPQAKQSQEKIGLVTLKYIYQGHQPITQNRIIYVGRSADNTVCEEARKKGDDTLAAFEEVVLEMAIENPAAVDTQGLTRALERRLQRLIRENADEDSIQQHREALGELYQGRLPKKFLSHPPRDWRGGTIKLLARGSL